MQAGLENKTNELQNEKSVLSLKGVMPASCHELHAHCLFFLYDLPIFLSFLSVNCWDFFFPSKKSCVEILNPVFNVPQESLQDRINHLERDMPFSFEKEVMAFPVSQVLVVLKVVEFEMMAALFSKLLSCDILTSDIYNNSFCLYWGNNKDFEALTYVNISQ